MAASDVQVLHFECGLFDPGVHRRAAEAPVQSACFVQAVQRVIADPAAHAKDPGSGHLVVAVAQALPAGETIEPDRTPS